MSLLLFLVLVAPKGTMYIYDPVKNKNQAVANIPQGIIIFSGLTNQIYRGLKDIIETAGSPIIDFDNLGYGTGFEMLAQVCQNLQNFGVLCLVMLKVYA